MNDYSRDETEFGAFEDPARSGLGRQQGCFVGVSPMLFPAVALTALNGVLGSDESRDETEFGAFEDPSAAVVGGLFDKIIKPFKKKTDAKVNAGLKAQGATAAQMALVQQAQAKAHVTAADIAKGVATSAKIGMAVASFLVPGGAVAGTAALGGLVAADKLVAAGQRGVAAAKTTIDTTKKLAAAGHVDSQRGLQMIGLASAERLAKGIPAGVEQKVTAAGHSAYTSFLSARKPTVVQPVKAAPKPAAPPKLPAIPPPRPAAAAPARAPIVAVAPPRPALPVAPRPVAPVPVAAPKPAMTIVGLQMLANTLSSALRAGKMPPATAKRLFDQAKAKVPPTATSAAQIAAIAHQLDVAAGTVNAPSSGITSPGTVVPAPARDWLVTDDGKVQRITRGNAIHVAGRGWYVGQFGLQRIGA